MKAGIVIYKRIDRNFAGEWLRDQRAKLSGQRLPVFSMMGEFASVTTQLKEPCAAWLSAEKIGPSQGRMPEGTGPQSYSYADRNLQNE
jgi:hypothetical protein